MAEGLLSMISAGCGQIVKMLITLQPQGIFGLCFAHLFIVTLPSQWYANGDETLPNIILLVKVF